MHAQVSGSSRQAAPETEEPWASVLRDRGSGERALLCAVLADAVRCLTHTIGGGPKDQARLAVQARRWVLKRGEDWPYSFENVCAALGLHPRLTRSRTCRADRKSTRLNSSHRCTSYAVLCVTVHNVSTSLVLR